MELRTEIHIPPSPFKIDHTRKIYFTGSCFSENIADKFRYFGFKALANSHGIIYNPFSINQSIYELANGIEYTRENIEHYNGRYFSYHHHGDFSSPDAEEVIEMINNNLGVHRKFLKEANVVFVTLGTVWVYTIAERQLIVANCHKIPANIFEKDFLTLPNLDQNLGAIIENIRVVNPTAKIVFTVSPVKHLKDGFIENQFSKSLLHIAIQNQLGDDVFYFPAFEIMNDDLRDYRFWKEDMIHPNQLAIDYIWEKLAKTYFDANTEQVITEVKKLRQFLDHRPLSNDPKKIEELNAEKERKKTALNKKYPQLVL